jgi:hypothetical protein
MAGALAEAAQAGPEVAVLQPPQGQLPARA